MCRSTDAMKPIGAAQDGAKIDLPNSKEDDTKATAAGQRLVRAEEELRLGTLYGSLSLLLIVTSFSLTMPHMQSRRDALGCDSLCLGSMTSARSALSLVGSALVGRTSDSNGSGLAMVLGGGSGRKACMYVGCISSFLGLVIAANMDSLRGMWLSMIPGALFQQNFSVMKAMLSDYHESVSLATVDVASEAGREGSKSKESAKLASARAGSVGKLGMAAGIAFMVGPLASSVIAKTYDDAVRLSAFAILLSAILIWKLPQPHHKNVVAKGDRNGKDEQKTFTRVIMSFLDVKAARSPAAVFIMSMRVCMALAFHIFHTIWTVSLKKRFDFGPSDHGKFMSFIGLTYALSQGLVAKKVVGLFGQTARDRVRLIQLCCLFLGAGRYFAFHTTSLASVYVMFAFVISSLGVLNTVLTADVSVIAPSGEVGGLFGVLEAVESIAGMIGPMLGGALALVDPVSAPLLAVVGFYLIVFALTTLGYERYVLSGHAGDGVKKQQDRLGKDDDAPTGEAAKKQI
uniref:Major facilitator superfamily (MFS) profile domain-containing protein n=1 Tax=Trieres chinensis TaxID=1514140 RepID=A0A7S2ELQ3_TRICV|mmetsp:Transcript_29704/g.60683  ORF Transcript_29704/g.60683 Transcript_29704/m.60683 type:complete len:515 (+) Transcript_29704:79-1623(+)|eukprot:CAMPEP_0183309812 /NCGR_PEP_ID=MMETSP0160_2-20130417/25555_1 /TAXON_ID=2839 ORGANISM="Odontella Sinensis, Strain Grunow 1884" /NCGR_SAMPLE_ID=MMETSP0160_2 /ASSEMBLY_ACC=CAM_ASM_000250 /LENGTH=514 /DNA_ID=CAMNT_0025473891 /DNA_START=33 /DNA_END=1577 /DNA_ORIENTATION=+